MLLALTVHLGLCAHLSIILSRVSGAWQFRLLMFLCGQMAFPDSRRPNFAVYIRIVKGSWHSSLNFLFSHAYFDFTALVPCQEKKNDKKEVIHHTVLFEKICRNIREVAIVN